METGTKLVQMQNGAQCPVRYCCPTCLSLSGITKRELAQTQSCVLIHIVTNSCTFSVVFPHFTCLLVLFILDLSTTHVPCLSFAQIFATFSVFPIFLQSLCFPPPSLSLTVLYQQYFLSKPLLNIIFCGKPLSKPKWPRST